MPPTAARTRTEARHRALVWVAAALVAAAGLFGLAEVRARSLQTQQLHVAESRNQLMQDVTVLRRDLAPPVRDAREAASASRVLVGEAVLGWEPDRDEQALLDAIDRRSAELRDAADELVAADRRPAPQRPQALPASTLDPLFDRIRHLDWRAQRFAERLREVADTSESLGETAHALTAAAQRFIGATSDLPDSDDPQDVADGLRDEVERLEPYRDAAQAATEEPTLAPLAELHLDLVASLTEFADAGADALEQGDVETYEQLRAELPGEFEDTTAAIGELTPRIAESAVSDLEKAEARALGLLHELEQLRRDTPARLAVAGAARD